MLDPDNYILQDGSYNKSLGGKLTIRYRKPLGYTGAWPPK
jgi:hypothetical protein